MKLSFKHAVAAFLLMLSFAAPVAAGAEQPSHSVDWWVQRGFRSANPTDEERQAIYRQQLMSVPMQRRGALYVVPVLINYAITLDFVVDSGADDVRIPADVVMTLMRTGKSHGVRFPRTKTICACGWFNSFIEDISYQVAKSR